MAPMPPTQDLIFDVLQRRYLMKFLRIARWSIPLLALLLLFSSAAPVFADDPPDPKKLASAIEDATVSLNVMWTLIAGFLVFFMQAGFALVETGFTHLGNDQNIRFQGKYICYPLAEQWMVVDDNDGNLTHTLSLVIQKDNASIA